MLHFIRKGLVFQLDELNEKMCSHAQVPFGLPLDDDVIRIYFATRNKEGCSQVTYIESDLNDFSKVFYLQEEPILQPGKLGTFDDRGTMPSWIVPYEDKLFLYYTAWNLGGNISYRLSIGLAISCDGGKTYKKFKNAPIMDRSEFDEGWVAQPCVIREMDKWRMWYLSCTKWEMVNDHPEPFYNVKYAESINGIDWVRRGHICIDYDTFTDAIGRPSVFIENGMYKMVYSYRNAIDYRTDPEKSYRLGYAESVDGIHFIRKDSEFKLNGEKQPWESQMQEYAHIFKNNGRLYMLYNGNGFGRSGFGYALNNFRVGK